MIEDISNQFGCMSLKTFLDKNHIYVFGIFSEVPKPEGDHVK